MAAKPRHVAPPTWEHPPEFPQLARYLAEGSPQPMVAVEGLTHIVRYANPAFLRLLGKGDQDLIGRLFAEAVPETLVNGCAPLLDRVFATGTPEMLTEQEHGLGALDAEAEGGALPAHWSYLVWAILGPVRGPAGRADEKPVGVMIQVTDSTEIAGFRKAAAAINEALLESGLRQHELMGEAEKLNAELRESDAHEREARQEAQAANRGKDIFLAVLSHELRTPLNAILGWAVMLRSLGATEGKPIDADVDHGLAVIERNARAQSKLIEDVLDVARVVSGKFQLDRRPCDLVAVAFAGADAVRPAALAKGVILEVRAEPEASFGSLTLMADAPRLNQAVLNLVSNAVTFTPKGGRVTVRLERQGEVARVIVSDTGKGIRSEFLPFVFDRFKQADEGSTRIFGGLGLGLTIVRHIAELHGGTVKAHSDGEGRGATFTLELPLLAPPAATPARPLAEQDELALAAAGFHQPPAVNLNDLRVLVVDDEEDARDVARMALESAGATVMTAASAEEAFQLAAQTIPPPHILVSDLAMPGEDGFSLIRRLRGTGANARDLPAVALTAFAGPEDKRRARLAGFQVHMPKPVDPHELIAAVGSLAGRTGV